VETEVSQEEIAHFRDDVNLQIWVCNRQKVFSVICILLFSVYPLKFVHSSINRIQVLFFYEAGCHHCKRINDFLEERIKPNYPVMIKKYEIHKLSNADTLRWLASVYNAEVTTPIVFIGNNYVQKDDRIALRKIEVYVREALRNHASSPLSRLGTGKDIFKHHLTLPAVIGAAAVDAINPCAFAVLTILLGTILLSSKRRERVLWAGLAFTGSTFVSYFLMGFGLFSAIRTAEIQYYVYTTVAVLAILIGLWNMKDFLWYGRWLKMEVPESWRPKLRDITSSVTSMPGAFSVGFLTSLFLLPCSSGPYVVIIGMLGSSSTRIEAVWLLLLYNQIFVLPFIIITIGVAFGLTTTERIEQFRQRSLEKLHLVIGIVMFVLGAAMISKIILD